MRMARLDRSIYCFAMLSAVLLGCAGEPWTARVCSSNASGNCSGVDNTPHGPYPVKSALGGVADVDVHEPACGSNGIGAVDVKVVSHDELQVTVHCLVDTPTGTMTLPETSSATPPPSGGEPQP